MSNAHSTHITRIAIIVPSRNEATVIERCLVSLAAQVGAMHMQVIVCVNGTTDDTATIVRAAALTLPTLDITVIEVDIASKTSALNAGDALINDADVWIYLDADLELSPTTVASLCAALASDAPLMAQPTRSIANDTRSWGRIAAWALITLPWVAQDIALGGIFAVNRAGRARWAEFPRVAADDAFAIGQFAAHERRVVAGCSATHPMPPSLRGLFMQQKRWGEGGAALTRSEFNPPHGSAWSSSRRLKSLACSPKAIVAAIIIRLIRLGAEWSSSTLRSDSWIVERAPARRSA